MKFTSEDLMKAMGLSVGDRIKISLANNEFIYEIRLNAENKPYLLNEQNLPFEVMLPLIDETARKVHELQPKDAQTGPAIRYDVNVINSHMEMLADKPEVQEIYEKISKNIHRYDKL